MFSKILTLNRRQWLKGLGTAIVGTAIASLISTMTAGALPLTLVALKPILMTGGISGLSYISHSLAENSDGKPLTKEPVIQPPIVSAPEGPKVQSSTARP